MMERLSPEDIQLESVSKNFEYEKISRQIDECDDVAILKQMLRVQVKLYYKLQETMISTLKMK